MEAKVGSNPSLIWRSLLAALETIHVGSSWKIGDGRSIRIWDDKWLLDEPRRKDGGIAVELVQDLLDMDRHWWNGDTIYEWCF